MMKYGLVRLKCVCIWIILLAAASMAKSFYVDPQAGSMTNDGSALKPWKTLGEVINGGLIEMRGPAVSTGESPVSANAGGPVKAGDTLVLRNGYHGYILLRSAYNSAPIVIMAQPGHHPSISRLRFQDAAKWTMSGLTISPEFEPNASSGAIVQIGSPGSPGSAREIIIDNCEIYSAKNFSSWTEPMWLTRAYYGIDVSGMRNTIRTNRLTCVLYGITVRADSNLIERNSIVHFAHDAYRGIANDLTFQYNTARNCYRIDANHDDGFQSWSLGPGNAVGTGTMRRVKLIGNTIIMYGKDAAFPFIGSMQGIGCFDGMFEDWTIENNVILVDHWHGITLMGAIGCRIVNNTVCHIKKGTIGPPWIRIGRHKNGTPSRGCLIRNNLSTGFSIDDSSSVTMDHNVKITDPNLVFADFAGYDVRLKAGSPAIGAGTPLGAPATDILGYPRPKNGPVDAGAYCYTSTPAVPAFPAAAASHDAPSIEWAHASRSKLTAKFSLPPAMDEHARRATVELYSLRGAVLGRGAFVNSSDAEANVYVMNTRPLSPGVYLMRVTFGNSRVLSEKIAVK